MTKKVDIFGKLTFRKLTISPSNDNEVSWLLMKEQTENIWRWQKPSWKLCGVDVGISASSANASAVKFQLPTLKHVETFIDMMQMQNILFYVLERETFVVNVSFKIFHHVM